MPNMFTRSFAQKSRVSKANKLSKPPSFRRSDARERMLEEKMMMSSSNQPRHSPESADGASPQLTSAIATIVVGRDQRLFAAHEDVLCHSPYFATALQDQFSAGAPNRRIHLPDEDAEVFSCVLEYLYKGDYHPRLLHDKRRDTWQLEGQHAGLGSPASLKSSRGRGAAAGAESATILHSGVNEVILRDTAVYCAAGRYGLDELQRLALRKQGLQSGVEVSAILRSARYAYDNTPDSDSRLRAHYLALIIRSRRTFKRSGTMQMEMEMGGRLFFDLFVAMCNHMDDLTDHTAYQGGTPRTV